MTFTGFPKSEKTVVTVVALKPKPKAVRVWTTRPASSIQTSAKAGIVVCHDNVSRPATEVSVAAP
ncbi:hypothetical protein [Streptomyces sp. NPDC058653]|uniref:hypothetical protein n=1 Tax=Streptomyces sp. NPDC058653 TaxID=3346576 RepID=UPI003655ABE6